MRAEKATAGEKNRRIYTACFTRPVICSFDFKRGGILQFSPSCRCKPSRRASRPVPHLAACACVLLPSPPSLASLLSRFAFLSLSLPSPLRHRPNPGLDSASISLSLPSRSLPPFFTITRAPSLPLANNRPLASSLTSSHLLRDPPFMAASFVVIDMFIGLDLVVSSSCLSLFLPSSSDFCFEPWGALPVTVPLILSLPLPSSVYSPPSTSLSLPSPLSDYDCSRRPRRSLPFVCPSLSLPLVYVSALALVYQFY
ncbi:hypothetical protein ACLOJK_038500 [Asimina triloba]